MAWHPERTEHTYFCPRCKEEFERSEPGKCDDCGMTLVPAGYCRKCKGYWRRRVGDVCVEHDCVLEGEQAAEADEMDEEARAVDPGFEAELVYRGDPTECFLLDARLRDNGVESWVDDGRTDIAAWSYLRFTEGQSGVLVPRKELEAAKRIVEEFVKEERSETS